VRTLDRHAEAAVLLLDDDAPIRRMLGRSLSAEGYEVCAVGARCTV